MKEQLKMDKKIAASQREDRTPQKLLIYIVINDSIENDKLVHFTLDNKFQLYEHIVQFLNSLLSPLRHWHNPKQSKVCLLFEMSNAIPKVAAE